jgi:hypothetical protein
MKLLGSYMYVLGLGPAIAVSVMTYDKLASLLPIPFIIDMN